MKQIGKKVSLILLVLACFSLQAQTLDHLILQVVEAGGISNEGEPTESEWEIAWYNQYDEYVTDNARIVVIAFNGYTREYALYEVASNEASINNDTTCVYRATFQRGVSEEAEAPERMRVFKELTDSALSKYPSNNLTLKYTGHGAEAPMLFGGFIDGTANVQEYLAHVVASYGKKIDLLDWNTNCNVLSVNQLEAQAPYARYFLASELFRGGFSYASTFTDGTPVSFMNDIMPLMNSAWYIDQFSGSIEDAAKGIIDKLDTYWSFDPVKQDMINKALTQSIYLVDCAKFLKLLDYVYIPSQYLERQDYLIEEIREHDPTAEPYYDSMMVYGTNNRDFFAWDAQYSHDGPIFWWGVTRAWGNNNKSVATPDTTVTYDTNHHIGKDTVAYETRAVQANSDTLVTTKSYQRTYDTTVVRTDSLVDGTLFYRGFDTTGITIDSVLLSTTQQTLSYQANIDTTIAYYNVYDTTGYAVVDSTVLANADTLVSTREYRVIKDSYVKVLAIFIDYQHDRNEYDMVSITYDTTLLNTAFDTLKNVLALFRKDSTYHLIDTTTYQTIDTVADLQTDTVITTKNYRVVTDTTVNRMDSLSDGVIFKTVLDTVDISVDTSLIDSVVDTFPVVTAIIPEATTRERVLLYPSPVRTGCTEAFVGLPQEDVTYRVRIFSAAGDVLVDREGRCSEKTLRIDVQNYLSGAYLVVLESENFVGRRTVRRGMLGVQR